MSKKQLPVDKVNIRMYRPGTGDFFILTFKINNSTTFKLMIDCGCIQGSRAIFAPLINDLASHTDSEIDLLIVTHEHADHINGFGLMKDEFDKIIIKKVWLAWTEDSSNLKANEYRGKITAMKVALGSATSQLIKLKDNGHYQSLYNNQYFGDDMVKAKLSFIDAVEQLELLNYWGVNQVNKTVATMVDMLEQNNIIKPNTVVEFLSPNDLLENIKGLPGIRFFILGPPSEHEYLKLEERYGDTYEKRQTPSTTEVAFVNALTRVELGLPNYGPFDSKYELDAQHIIVEEYNTNEIYRKIDDDWLYTAGSLGLKLQGCINNTSLAIAIQFIDSEKVLLFPGDAEFGSWLSWKNELQWTIDVHGVQKTVNLAYVLKNTIFYKVSHHLSHNGTPSSQALLQMTHQDLQAMVTLDFSKIMSGWKNTMPNDFIGAELIKRTQGRIYFSGNSDVILKNISTDRVTVRASHVAKSKELNAKFDNSNSIDIEISSS